jgi:hypothetical protein
MRVKSLGVLDSYSCPSAGTLKDPQRFGVRKESQPPSYFESYQQQDTVIQAYYVLFSRIQTIKVRIRSSVFSKVEIMPIFAPKTSIFYQKR